MQKYLTTFIFFLSLQVFSEPIYIKSEDINFLNDHARNLSENDCDDDFIISMYDYDIKTILLVKLDIENKKATISAGTYNSSGEINYANIRRIPDGKRVIRLEEREFEVYLKEELGTYSSKWGSLTINRNTLEGSFYTRYDTEPCGGLGVSNQWKWGKGSILTADEYNTLFLEINRKSDELDKEFEELKKATRKF